MNSYYKKFGGYIRLMRLDKPVGILLLLWPTLWGLVIAGQGQLPWPVLFIFIAGVILMRSAGCVVNDIADRNFDGQVERTKDRPLVSGEVNVKDAGLLAAALVLTAFILVCFLNAQTILLSFAALALAVTYPLMKRYIAIPQAYLGVAFGFGIPMAFAATTNQVPYIAWILLLANMFWAIAYDTAYAMVDRKDDQKIGIQSSAILFGHYDVLAIMVCYVIMLGLFVYVGNLLRFGSGFYLSLIGALLLVIWQYALIRKRQTAACFKAFRMSHWVGAILFLGLVFEYY